MGFTDLNLVSSEGRRLIVSAIDPALRKPPPVDASLPEKELEKYHHWTKYGT